VKTYVPKEVESKWYVIDAEGKTLGRLAAKIASILRGKHKPEYTPNLPVGDYVIVVNAAKVKLTGKKLEDKIYTRYSGYQGGLKRIPAGEMLKRHPERVIERAVKGMLPKNRLGRKLYKRLKVYAGPDHPHAAQKPEKLELEVR